MTSPWLNLLVGGSGYGVVVFVAALVVFIKFSQSSKLDAIPTVGSITWLGSWWAGLKHLINPLDVIQEGYEKHNRAPFKIAIFGRWLVVLSSREHVEEVCRAPEDTLSFSEAVNAELQVEYTLGHKIFHNPYHVTIIRSHLARNAGALYPEIRSEMITAFDDILDLSGDEWKSVPALRSVQTIICRASNRVFVGLPLCRDPDWIDLNMRYILRLAEGGLLVRLFPTPLKSFASRWFTRIAESNDRAMRLVGPVIEEQLSYLNDDGNQSADKPNNLLTWLIDGGEGPERTVESLTARILGVNFGLIHTPSVSFTHALFCLAANPQYVQPLREEVDAVIQKEGWSKASLAKMRKVDSFLKECQRMKGVNLVSLMRKAMKDFTFSDGTFIPKGTAIAAASRAVHYDEAFYPDAHEFKPFRFADLQGDEEGVDHQYISTAPEYLAFGHGKRACPGRVFATVELKSMLAHIVTTYDVKLEDDKPEPQMQFIGTLILPDTSAKVMFRKRA